MEPLLEIVEERLDVRLKSRQDVDIVRSGSQPECDFFRVETDPQGVKELIDGDLDRMGRVLVEREESVLWDAAIDMGSPIGWSSHLTGQVV